MTATIAGFALIGLALPLLYLNLYFFSLALEGWEEAARKIGFLVRACGVAGGSCSVVARTRWARALFGVPNSFFGLAWCGVLLWLGVTWLETEVITVPWWVLAIASSTVVAAVVLIWVLVAKLQQSCPL